jgi:hypothetical protein
LHLHIIARELWFSVCNTLLIGNTAGKEPTMTRNLLIVLILPIVAAIGCAADGPLRRVEVWKQQTILDPAPSETMSPQLVPPAGAETMRIGSEPG